MGTCCQSGLSHTADITPVIALRPCPDLKRQQVMEEERRGQRDTEEERDRKDRVRKINRIRNRNRESLETDEQMREAYETPNYGDRPPGLKDRTVNLAPSRPQSGPFHTLCFGHPWA